MALSKQAIRERDYTFFISLKKKFGRTLAFFYASIHADVPFSTVCIPPENENSAMEWREYNDNLITLYKNKYPLQPISDFGFVDGQTDVLEVYGSRMSTADFAKTLNVEVEAEESKAGTQAQRKKWGIGNPDEPYTVDDYKRLDQLYDTFSERLKDPDSQQVYIITDVSMMALQKEKCQAVGDIKNAAQLSKMIQDSLASENLRKKDKQLEETEHIDSVIEILERQGLLLSLEEVQKWILESTGMLGGNPSHKFNYTIDAADHIIEAIVNTMRNNQELPEYDVLPDELRLDEAFAAEFADKPNKAEQEAYNEIGIVRFPKQKGGKSP